jgi:hypothetical protein
MSKLKVTKIGDEKIPVNSTLSDSENSISTEIFKIFGDCQLIRNRTYMYFNDVTLTQYIDNSVKRFNGYIPPRGDLMSDWQAHVFNNFTRNMVVSFLSKVALQPPKAKVEATNDNGYGDRKGAYILEKFVTFADREEGYEWRFFNASLELSVKGTVIGYEGYKKIKQEIRDGKYNLLSGKTTEEKKKTIFAYDNPFHTIVPLEEFYPGNIFEPDIQMQPYMIWHSIMRFDEAKRLYGKYSGWSKVVAGAFIFNLDQTIGSQMKYVSGIQPDQVEVIRYYNRWIDRFVLIISGVPLYDGPMPFDHKMYPFTKTIFEPFAIDFFYGKSLPDKIGSDQDVINTLWNMMIDQGILSLYKPILTQDPDDLDDSILVPGRIKKVSNIADYKVMNEITGPDSSHVNLLNMAMKFANDNGGSMGGSGMDFTPRGGKISPRQIMIAEENARRMVGLSARLLEDYERQRMTLRIRNILQFWTSPQRIEAIAGAEDAAEFSRVFYKSSQVPGTMLEDGTMGTSIIRVQDQADMPSSSEIEVEETMAEMMGQNVEIKVVSPEYIRGLSFKVQIVAESSFAQNKALEHSETIEMYNMLIMNPLVDQMELTKAVFESFDKDPARFIKQGQPAPAVGPDGQIAMGPQGASSMLGQQTGAQGARKAEMTMAS